MARRPAPSSRNPALLVVASLGGVVALALVILVLIRHHAPPPTRRAAPPAMTAPAPVGSLAPVYSGGAIPGKRRTGF